MLHADLHPQQETLIRPPEKGAFLFAEKDRGEVRNVRENKSRQNMYYIKSNGGLIIIPVLLAADLVIDMDNNTGYYYRRKNIYVSCHLCKCCNNITEQIFNYSSQV